MKKKMITLLLGFTMLLSCVACGGQQNGVKESQQESRQTMEAVLPTEPSTTMAEVEPSINYNDWIALGTYEQDNNLENGQEPMIWQVKDKNENGYLLKSVCAIDFKKFHNTEENVTWETSDIRTWLNGEFYNEHFTAEEQSKILLTTVDNSEDVDSVFSSDSAKKYEYQQSNDTQDYIFLLSELEVAAFSYSPDFLDTVVTTAYSAKVCETLAEGSNIYEYMYPGGGPCCYLTRSLTASPEVFNGYLVEKFGKNVQTAVYVVDTGHFSRPTVFWDDAYAVVPVMWVKKDAQYETVAKPS